MGYGVRYGAKMRVILVAGAGVALAFVAMFALSAQPRADEPATQPSSGAGQAPRAAAPAAKHDEALAASKREEPRIGTPTATSSPWRLVPLRDPATAATAAENAARGPGLEAPRWGDPAGVDVGAVASEFRAMVVPRPALHETAATPVPDNARGATAK